MKPDPYLSNSMGPGTPSDPESWNRYAYVEGDAINFNDPSGTTICFVNPKTGVIEECYDSTTVIGMLPSPISGGGGGNDRFSKLEFPPDYSPPTVLGPLDLCLLSTDQYFSNQRTAATSFVNGISAGSSIRTAAIIGGLSGAIQGANSSATFVQLVGGVALTTAE
jgi:hypothetical protein